MALHISKMSGKLEGIPAVNTNTLSNEFCQKMGNSDTVCALCYSRKMLETYRKGCIPKFEQNSKFLSGVQLPRTAFPRINAAVFRLHGHGELVNLTHLINLAVFAGRNPLTTFSLWTKRKNLVSQFLSEGRMVPNNLILIYSNPDMGSVSFKVPKGFHKVFNVVEEAHSRENCTGKKCLDCLLCYQKSTTNVIVERQK